MSNNIAVTPVEKYVINPLSAFIRNSIMSGVVLLIAAVIAVILANSPLSDAFLGFWQNKISIGINDHLFLNYDLQHWVNDGLISIFFFVLGLELKREIVGGQLSGARNALLPIAVGLGGMLFPALIFLLFNQGAETRHGWGIPMATDIAFALGVLHLLGKRIPTSVKIFLTAFGIIDDLGAILVIALFYTSDISFLSLGIGFGCLGLLFLANKLGVRNTMFYAIFGIAFVWLPFLLSGVHATIAAVLVAFTIPANTKLTEGQFLTKNRRYATKFNAADVTDSSTVTKEQLHILKKIKSTAKNAMTPLQRLELSMHPVVSFVVMPIFALANAGVVLDIDFKTLFSNNISIGIVVALMVGKMIGIFGVTYLMVKTKISKLPRGMTVNHLFGVSIISGIGFTMSIFITSLAYADAVFITQAKIGIFAASILAGTLGYFVLKLNAAKVQKRKDQSAAQTEKSH